MLYTAKVATSLGTWVVGQLPGKFHKGLHHRCRSSDSLSGGLQGDASLHSCASHLLPSPGLRPPRVDVLFQDVEDVHLQWPGVAGPAMWPLPVRHVGLKVSDGDEVTLSLFSSSGRELPAVTDVSRTRGVEADQLVCLAPLHASSSIAHSATGLYAFDDLHPLTNSTKHDVFPIQRVVCLQQDEELRAIGVRGILVCHAEEARSRVRQIEALILKVEPIHGLATSAVTLREVTPLHNEVWDHTMEAAPLIVKGLPPYAQSLCASAQESEVLRRARHDVRVEHKHYTAELDAANRYVEEDAGPPSHRCGSSFLRPSTGIIIRAVFPAGRRPMLCKAELVLATRNCPRPREPKTQI
mmetsp:Transcript_33445/g.73174  ORF Transcript_33445/g.73174 Transcript_33445/m.73174 type:complete len:354 (+) Transcript_33445:216-1277(+)